MTRNIVRRWSNVLAVLATVAMNILANALPLNGQNTGEISDSFAVFFVPAGYVFAIWGVIYLGLLAFAIYQYVWDNLRLHQIGYWFVLSCVANVAWLFLWHYNQFVLTLAAMLVLLASLIAVYLRLEIGREPASGLEKLMVDAPFSLYLGWISVATIANFTTVLEYLHWDGWGVQPEMWAVIMLIAGVFLAVLMSLTRKDVIFQLVIVWAFIGIAVKQATTPVVSVTAWIAAVAVLTGLLMGLFFSRRHHR